MYMARPKTDIPQETYDSIFKDIASSSLSLKSICKKHNVPYNAFYNQMLDSDELINRYARAKQLQADVLADEIIDIADDATNDYMSLQLEEGEIEKIDHEHVNRSRIRIDARKWKASKLMPKKYGDKIEHELKGSVVSKIVTEVVDPTNNAENEPDT